MTSGRRDGLIDVRPLAGTDLQYTYRCDDCGAEFTAGRRQCDFCGTVGAETDRTTCRDCGKRLTDSTYLSCPVCGSRDVDEVAPVRRE